ncbi:MAG TPA: AraC family transcriptional regulator [Kofleriaceae bacterium]|nr:AraC family transcriptional regulator [Kofleriaceae bacterium]
MASGALLRRLVRARDLLHADAARNPTLDELAAASGVSRAHLARNFTQTFGISPHQYLVQLRLEQARRALAAGTSVTEVCHEVGFESLGTFSSTFRKRVGLSPREYQRRARPFVQSLGVPILYIPSCFLYGAHV